MLKEFIKNIYGIAATGTLFLAGCGGTAAGSGGEGVGGVCSITDSSTTSSEVFAGLSSIDQVSGGSMRLNWAAHPQAHRYLILDLSSGSPVLFGSVDSSTTSFVAAGLSATTAYTFRVRMVDQEGKVDSNTQDRSATTTAQTTPPDVDGLVLWLKADAGVTQDGSNRVSLWADQSSAGLTDVSQSNSANQPVWVASAINGQPALRFDGLTDALAGSSVVTGGDARTIFIVANKLSSTDIYDVPFDLAQTVTGSGTNFAITTEMAVRVSGNRVFNSGLSIGVPNVLSVRAAAGANVTAVEGWVGGVAATQASASSATLNTLSSGIVVGRAGFAAGAGGYCNCDIAEIVVYHAALSDTNRVEIENYLKDKYGL